MEPGAPPTCHTVLGARNTAVNGTDMVPDFSEVLASEEYKQMSR